MYLAPDVALQERLQRWSKYLVAVVILIALLVFAGWQFNIPILRRPAPNLVAMNPVSALCFLFIGASFLLITSNKSQKTGLLLAAIAGTVGLLKCLDLIFHAGIGIDQFLFTKELQRDLLGNISNKMAPNTAICFMLTSFSIIYYSLSEGRKKILVSQYVSLLVALIGWLSILGYLYRESVFYGLLVYIPMAIHTAICFFLFSLAMLFNQSRKGMMKEVTGKLSGSIMARALLPAVIVIPTILGYLRMAGYRAGFYTNEFGVAILILFIIIIFAAIVWFAATLLNKRDLQKIQAEKALRDSEQQITAIFENAPDVVVVIDQEGIIDKWNPQAEKVFGWKEEEVVGRFLSEIIIPPQFRESHRKGMQRYISTGESTILNKNIELFAVRKDNTEVDVSLSISPMKIGNKQYFIGFIRDITEKKSMENKMKSFNETLAREVEDKTKQLTHMFERITDGFIALDKDFRYTYMNKKAGEITHMDPAKLIGRNVWDVFPQAVGSTTYNAFTSAMETQQYTINTDYYEPLDLWQENHIYPSPEGLSIFIKDISDRKRSEREIIQARDLADKLIDSLPGVFYFYDATGKFIKWNKHFEEVTEYTAEEIANMHPTQFFAEEDRDYITQRIMGVFEKGVNDAETYFLTKSGKRIPYYFKAVLIQYQGGPCLLGNGIDITERKKAEQQLLMSENRFRSIIEQFPYPVVIYNTDGDYIQTNEAWEKMWHEKRENVKGYNIRKDPQMISSGLSKVVEKAFAGEVAISEPYEYDPALIGHPEALKRWMVMTLYPLKDAKDEILEVVLVLHDVTDRKEAERELKLSELKYKLLFANNPLAMWMLSLPEYNFVDVNNAALKQYGYSRKEFLDLNILDLRPEEDVVKFNNTLNTNLRGVHYAGIWRHRKKDGTVIYVEIITHDFIDDGRATRVVLANDVTEKHIADEKLNQSFSSIRELTEHLQQIREEERAHMAREIHDELGQLLTVLKMDVSWLNKKVTTDDVAIKEKFKDLLEMLDTTVKTVRRIASELRPTLLDDLGLVAAMEWHLEEFEKRSGITKEFSNTVAEVNVDDSTKIGLFRILQESLTNVARHSQADKVIVDLSTVNGHLVLKIADNGKGFDTTRTTRKTLGLLGMNERTKMMGGEYNITSKPGEGTTVEVIVPAAKTD